MRACATESARNGDSDLTACDALLDLQWLRQSGLHLGRYLDDKNSLLVNDLHAVRVERGDNLADG